ncbi:transposase family protein, partial [Cyclobacterium sediminis]
KDRIVSLHKPYVRPIVRGKENKPVEFGMKVHMLQVDGLSFIDKMSFRNFNECKRLKTSVVKHKTVFKGTSQLGADRIYATNENRRYCTGNSIFTCFPKKGPKNHSKAEKILSSEISKQRATVMEGIFGTHKDHYGLRKIKVRGEKREMLMVLFATMAANAVKIAKKRNREEPAPREKAA